MISSGQLFSYLDFGVIYYNQHYELLRDSYFLYMLYIYISHLNVYSTHSFTPLSQLKVSQTISSTEMIFPGPSEGGISLLHFMTHIKTTSTDSFCFTSPDLLK